MKFKTHTHIKLTHLAHITHYVHIRYTRTLCTHTVHTHAPPSHTHPVNPALLVTYVSSNNKGVYDTTPRTLPPLLPVYSVSTTSRQGETSLVGVTQVHIWVAMWSAVGLTCHVPPAICIWVYRCRLAQAGMLPIVIPCIGQLLSYLLLVIYNYIHQYYRVTNY